MRLFNPSSTKNVIVFYIILEFILILTSIILLNYGFNYIKYILFIFTLIIAIFIKKNDLIIFIAMIIPIVDLFKYSIDSYTVLPFILLIYIIKSLFSRNKMSIKFITLFTILLLISLINSYLRFAKILNSIPFFINLLFMYFATQEVDNENTYNKSAIVFIVSTIIVIISTLIFKTATESITEVATGFYRIHGFSSPWNFALTMLISSAFVVTLLKKSIFNIVFSCSIISVFLYFSILTGTFSILIGFFLVIILLVMKVFRFFKFKILALLFLPIILIFFNFLIVDDMIRLRGEFSDNGRLLIWYDYLKIFINNVDIMLFGIGGSNINIYSKFLNMPTSHNFILELLIQFGIIGIFILFLIIYYIFKSCNIKFKGNHRIFPLIILLTFLLTQGGINEELLFLLLSLSSKVKSLNIYNERSEINVQR